MYRVVDKWEYYADNPLLILQLQYGGLAIWGALAGGGRGIGYIADGKGDGSHGGSSMA